MNYVGLFEGISGFGLAFKRAGANIRAMCEINAECQRVLRRHHPEAELIEDVKEIRKDTFEGGTIDILAGGFPCQDLSVAGKRKGLAGERSGLWFEFIRIIGDHKPRWVVIENVPGLLSSNGGRDFAVILRGLAECGYGVCWRVFDSQYDGVAQRRKRVFIVASFGNASCVEILFERESSQWDSPPSRKAGEGVAGNAIAGTVSSKWAKGTGGPAGDESYNLTVVPTLRSNGDARSGFTTGDGLVIGSREVAQSLTTNYGKQPDNSDTAMGPNLAITYNLTFCDANGRRADRPNGGLYVNETSKANTLTNAQQGGIVIAFAQNTRDEVRQINGDGQIVGALAAQAGMKQQSYVMAFTERTRAEGCTLEAQDEIAYALTNPGSGGRTHSRQIAGQFGVRRLTPTECERLQGFPDSWTAFGYDGKLLSDSARYRMLGNAVCVPTAFWVAERIMRTVQGSTK